ncbi:MAG: glycosyltransferase family 4 protein [Nitrospiraceae bacterium]|nr:glycosyltransferase family 4 protein [Nitrospiraceae bacterium]
MSDSVHLWIVNQYAIKANQAGGTRHHTFAHYMKDAGIETTIIAADSRHDGDDLEATKVARPLRVENLGDARFLWLRKKSYNGNGVGRVISMLNFSMKVVYRCWSPERNDVPRPDVIIGSSPHLFAALAGWILAKRHRVPFVLEVRDLWPKSLESLLGLNRHHPLIMLMGAIEIFLYRRSSLIIGLLPGMSVHVSLRAGASAADVVWIPNGVDLHSHPDAAPIRDSHDFTLIYTGAHGVPNSLHTVLDAARLLQESGERTPHGGSFRFEFFGEGICKSDLMAYARLHDLRHVTFHAAVPKSEVFGILSKADGLLLPGLSTTLYEYGISPNKLFDYFAVGRPVLFGLSLPHNPVSEASAGLTVLPESPKALMETIKTLSRMSLSDRQIMGENGRAFVEQNHDSKRLAARYATSVLSVIDDRAARALRPNTVPHAHQ